MIENLGLNFFFFSFKTLAPNASLICYQKVCKTRAGITIPSIFLCQLGVGEPK